MTDAQTTVRGTRDILTQEEALQPRDPDQTALHDVIRDATNRAAVYRFVSGVGQRVDVWSSEEALAMVPFASDGQTEVTGSIHRGATATLAWAQLLAVDPEKIVPADDGDSDSLTFGVAQHFLDQSRTQTDWDPAQDDRLLVVQQRLDTGPPTYLARTTELGGLWGRCEGDGALLVLRPGRWAQLWVEAGAMVIPCRGE